MASTRLSANKVRVSITPTKEVLSQVDNIAERLGLSRSATCSMLISTALESYNMVLNLPEEKMKVLIDNIK